MFEDGTVDTHVSAVVTTAEVAAAGRPDVPGPVVRRLDVSGSVVRPVRVVAVVEPFEVEFGLVVVVVVV